MQITFPVFQGFPNTENFSSLFFPHESRDVLPQSSFWKPGLSGAL